MNTFAVTDLLPLRTSNLHYGNMYGTDGIKRHTVNCSCCRQHAHHEGSAEESLIRFMELGWGRLQDGWVICPRCQRADADSAGEVTFRMGDLMIMLVPEDGRLPFRFRSIKPGGPFLSMEDIGALQGFLFHAMRDETLKQFYETRNGVMLQNCYLAFRRMYGLDKLGEN